MPTPVFDTPPSRLRRTLLGTCLAPLAGPMRAQTNMVDSEGRPVRAIEVPYVATPDRVVSAMLDLAGVGHDDVVYDLGCGDGRLVVAAARERGARGVGVEIDRELVALARARAAQAGVSDRVRFEEGDLFELDLRPATVVMMYLSDDLNTRLWPRLRSQLRRGARVVSHRFIVRDVPADKSVDAYDARLHMWTMR